ncbi:hypothetical protein [Halobacillus salinus]|uniref:DUF4367 domain-containing protein n=1 Tax=Halobacillus salinus TaxID=192814 RepID=A0A4Z0H5A2_9BACI|nr:hypothetical protein [Halobacillus salinus]TGB04949.1 hypothetical protein E4663_08130 [Halobacillus salinus]
MKKWIVPLLLIVVAGCSSETKASDASTLNDSKVDQLAASLEYDVQLPTKFPFDLERVDADIDSNNQQLNIHISNKKHGVVDVFIVEGPVTYEGASFEDVVTAKGNNISLRTKETNQTARWESKGIHYQVSSLSFEGQTQLSQDQFLSIVDHFE